MKVMSVKTVNSMVSEMRVNDSFNFTYKGKKYTFKCYKENSYSVDKNSFQTMNVDKISSKYVTIYDFDMMSQRTTYKIAIDEMELIGCGDEDIASDVVSMYCDCDKYHDRYEEANNNCNSCDRPID